ncbi:fungal-specific transcription factor domain-containing protein, partial [Amylocystis lapponica]
MSPFVPTPYTYPSLSSTLPIPSNDEHITYGAFVAPSGSAFAQQAIMPSSSAATASVPGPAPTTQEEYTFYYFEHVRKVQYPLAGNTLTNILYSIVVAEPRGAVATTICALSSLYSARSHIAQDLEPSETNPEQGMAKLFFDQALYQLINNKTLNGQYAETDAVAAVQLVSFSLLSGGWKDWTAVLEIACDWLAQTRIHEEQNPKLTLLSMSPAARFAARATMPPRFLSLYRRLFAGGAGYWASTQQLDLRMDVLTGCPDEAMLGIAEVSALAHWKAAELRAGSLSVRELIRRGDHIEQQLRARVTPRHWVDDETPLDPASPLGQDNAAFAREEARRVIVDIYREAAILYLHTVLSESLPGVPEINTSVEQMTVLLTSCRRASMTRAGVPAVPDGVHDGRCVRHELVKQRLLLLNDSLGNILQ